MSSWPGPGPGWACEAGVEPTPPSHERAIEPADSGVAPRARDRHNPASPFVSVPMSDSKLQTVVREIREQLAGAKDLSPETRRSLEALVQDLEAVADRTPGDTAAAEGLQDRLA